MSLLEAASCARPIVASDMPGCIEIVKCGLNGFIVSQNDPVALADALMILLEDDDMCEKFGFESRSLVKDNFDRRFIEAKTLDLYQSILMP